MRGCIVAAGALALSVLAAAAANTAPAKKGPAKPPPAKKPAVKPASSQAAEARALFAQLKKAEASVTTGRLTVQEVQRQGDLPDKKASPRETAQHAPVTGQRREVLAFSGSDWRRELTIMDEQTHPVAHILVGVEGKIGRVYQEKEGGDQAPRIGVVGIAPEKEDTQQLLSGHGASVLDQVEWKGLKRTAGHVTLTGAEGTDQVELVVRTEPRLAIEQLRRKATVVTGQGSVVRGQEITLTYAVEGRQLTPKTMEELFFVSPPIGKTLLTKFTIEGAQIGGMLTAEDLAITYPKGTKMVDQRFDPPVRYLQGDKDLTKEELTALADAQREKLAKVGKAAPDWDLKTLDGKTPKLAEYKGKVVMLVWFASWCEPCNLEAPHLQELWKKYADKGLALFGVNAAEREDPQKMAQQFVSRYSLTYPVLLDTDDELSILYQVDKFPTVLLIDRKGVLRDVHPGYQEADAIAEKIDALLAEP